MGLGLASQEREDPPGGAAGAVQTPSIRKSFCTTTPKQRYFLKSVNYFQLFSDPAFFFSPANFTSVILSHQVNLEKALVPPSPAPPLSNHVRAPPHPRPFSVVNDILGNTIGTSDCVSLSECKKLKSS